MENESNFSFVTRNNHFLGFIEDMRGNNNQEVPTRSSEKLTLNLNVSESILKIKQILNEGGKLKLGISGIARSRLLEIIARMASFD